MARVRCSHSAPVDAICAVPSPDLSEVGSGSAKTWSIFSLQIS